MVDWNCCEMHSHSTVSDGLFAPRKMAQMMAEAGVELWSLTDHDHVGGTGQAAQWAAKEGVTFVPGIEISASWNKQSIHVLGYGYDPEDERLRTYGEEMVEARRERMEKMVRRVGELGAPVEMAAVDAIAGEGNMGRPHLADAMVEAGHVEDKQQAFDRFLDRKGPAYVAVARPSVEECIEMIADAGGLAVIAHPGLYDGIEDQWKGWADAGLRGVEVRHPKHDAAIEARLLGVADAYGLVRTASQDWHGRGKAPQERLGGVDFPRAWREPFWEALEKTAHPPR